MTHYDIAIIGTGSGNTILGEEFQGQRVAILERGRFGGTCINVGCIPTKMFVVPADIERIASAGPRLGVQTCPGPADWPAIRDRIFGRIDPVATDGESYRRGQEGVDVYAGDCRFVGPRTIDTGVGSTITADQIVLAAGARAFLPDVPGLDPALAPTRIHTSDTIMRIDQLPSSLAIVGGGFIGAEFAHIFSAYGVQVTQIHYGEALLEREDADVSHRFTDLASDQWDVRLGTRVESAVHHDDSTTLHLSDENGLSTVEAEMVLIATGRVPNSDQLDLSSTGVEVDDDGFVVVDEHQQTTAPGIWALGDISSSQMLKHVANQDARVVRHNLLHPDDLRVSDHRFVPSAVFTWPQIATVGLTEKQAREQGVDVAVARHDYAHVAYGWALEDSGHFVKLVGDRATGLLVGAHLIGPQASILIQPLIQAMSFGQPVAGLARGQYWIHPALAEVVENALLALESALSDEDLET